jgi:hypothetical protein
MKTFFTIIQILGKIIHDSGADQNLGDQLLDTLEDFVQRTDNKVDDKLILPAIKALRIAFDIPDNDNQPEFNIVKGE